MFPPQCVVLSEHGSLEGVVVGEEVVVEVLNLRDLGIVGDAEKTGVESEGGGGGEEEEEEEEEERHGL